MRPVWSIRRRLVVQLAAIAALLSIAFLFAVRGVAERAAADTQDGILAASATSIADALYHEAGQIRLELPYSAISMLGTVSQDRVFYRVIVDGETLTGYDALPAADGASPAFQTLLFNGEDLRVVSIDRTLSDGNTAREVRVVVGQTQLGLGAISARISTTALAIGIPFFLVAISLSLWAAQTAIAPLDRLASAIERRGPNDLRPVTRATPRELVPLVDGLNSFMSRLHGALARSEDLITEAAHRVRTPLATVRTQAEVIHRNMEKTENRGALRDMIRAVDESSRSAGQLLDHAMVTLRSDQLETKAIDLGNLTQEIVDRLRPTAELKDISFVLHLPDNPAQVLGDPILLQNAVRNILDNAIKYSPAETEITITLTAGATHRLEIRDEGRGFADSDLPQLTKRFSRGGNVDDVVGSGLGLTIAKDVASAHMGNLVIAAKEEGSGACVTLSFPSA